jgi:hypothetical protein
MLLLSSGTCHAEDEEGVPAESPTVPRATTPPREGDTIWLEEKIAPPTRWIESLVNPLTTWMERQVQHPGTSPNTTTLAPWVNSEDTADTDNGEVAEAPTLTPAEAATIALQTVHGEVLRIKLIATSSRQPVYRVKLISDIGEIQILHINGHNGAIEPPAKPPVGDPSD